MDEENATGRSFTFRKGVASRKLGISQGLTCDPFMTQHESMMQLNLFKPVTIVKQLGVVGFFYVEMSVIHGADTFAAGNE